MTIIIKPDGLYMQHGEGPSGSVWRVPGAWTEKGDFEWVFGW